MNRPMKWCITAVLISLTVTWSAAPASSQDPDIARAGTNGLWRDMDNGFWCGGTCFPGQACCSIVR